ncbi:hypothetical protein [Rhodococcoides fascians]|uniref:hypothetical protein n=1 Tax=Rhodococcoides fascians TaxID=1828 RepID=UPI00050CC9E2|nr:hypothetical protein [Rhodococcus fascians]
MSRRISQSITPTAEDVIALREPFIARGANDPVIKELRDYFKGASPSWLTKLNEQQELTRERLAEIRDASTRRRSVIEALPAGEARDRALADLSQAEKVIDDMDTALAGAGAFGEAS